MQKDAVRRHQKLDWTGLLGENKESCERQKVLESLQHVNGGLFTFTSKFALLATVGI